MNTSRTRLLALLIVAAFCVASVGATTVSSAADATTAAKKKSKKKCKKGYTKKKVKGKTKCVKKKAAAQVPKVEAIKLGLVTSNKGQVKLTGDVKSSLGTLTMVKGEFAVTVGGVTQTYPMEIQLGRARSAHFSRIVDTSFPDTDGGTATLTLGGITSSSTTIR